MTSPISAISGLASVSGLSGVDGVTSVAPPNPLDSSAGIAATGGANADFGSMLSKGLESVQSSQHNADNLAVQVANGTLADPAQYTMAATEASLGLNLTMAIRNKALDAFQEIMRMQA
jgi:flagellar hook-basal body complex protein FliE